MLAVLSAVWAFSAWTTRKYRPIRRDARPMQCLAPYAKAFTLNILAFVFLTWLLPFPSELWREGIWILALASAAEALGLLLLRAFRRAVPPRIPSFRETDAFQRLCLRGKNLAGPVVEKIPVDPDSVIRAWNHGTDAERRAFLARNLKIVSGSSSPLAILNSVRAFSSRETVSAAFYLVTFRLNDVRRINRFLLEIHRRLLPGGALLVSYLPLERQNERRRRNTPGFIFPFLAIVDFIFHRVFPKIPRLNTVYFFLTRGQNRRLSRAEVWGRLHYCGYDVLEETVLEDRAWVLCQKIGLPSEVAHPSFYPLIRLERVGFEGRILKIHKIRTMYPFSEFIQKKIFDLKGLETSGKFNDDFRITSYGRWLRKYWLDEIPQFLDWLRGDLKLVGIRAMSLSYFSLYPIEYQDLFIRVKPGLVPPIFDEKTSTFDHIVDVEQRYLKDYLRNPYRADFACLWKTGSSILWRGTRSR